MPHPTCFSVLPNPKSCILKKDSLQTSDRKLHLVHSTSFPQKKTLEIIAGELGTALGITSCVDSGLKLEILNDPAPSHASPESYRLEIGESIRLYARADAGVLYGIATLCQLGRPTKEGALEFPRSEIEDYPDTPYRFASRWLIELEATRMAYDWGDGREKMLDRYRHKIDFCMRHKINAVFFEGFEWQTDKYPEYKEDIRQLNTYARARNVKLVFGGHVIGYGGYPGHTMEGAKGLGGYNRVSYPDGEIYACGKAADTFDRFFPSITSSAVLNGNCRSNEALNRLKQEQLAAYVREIEPDVLFLHSEDIAIYAEFLRMWHHRCDACRRRWPSDEIDSPTGAAGAIAHGFQWLYDGVASVCNPQTGYDAARDCLVIFASPTYSAFYDSDTEWRHVADFWTAVSRQLSHKDRIQFCIREQFWQMEEKALRIPGLAHQLITKGGGHGLFIFSVGGADLYNNSAFFSAAPRLNHFFEGAGGIFNFNGGLFAAPQEIYNCEYTWNLRSPHGMDEAADYEEAKAIYLQRSQEMRYPEPDKLLGQILKNLYGEAAADMEALYRLKGERNQFPLAIPFRLCHRLFRKSYAEHDAKEQQAQWGEIHRLTLEARTIIHRALQHPSEDAPIRDELEYLHGCLAFGARFSAIIAAGFAEQPDPASLQAEIEALREFVRTGYPRDFTSSHEGEMNLWPGYLDKLSRLFAEIPPAPTKADRHADSLLTI